MKASHLKKSVLAMTAISVLAGCVTPPANTPVGALKVVYSQHYPDGSYLKEEPTEVRLVTREATTKNVATQVGLNLLLLSVGALSFRGFSKDDLNGRPVDGPTDRAHLRNPIPTEFVARLQTRVDSAIQADDRLKTQTYAHPLVVGGGSTRLVYENLAGTEEATYRLKTDLVVYRKRGNGVSINSLMGPRTVSCADQSAHDWLKTDHFCVLNAATVFAANPFTRIQ
ncbi:MAG: hypothetical protein U1E12_17695 [Hydrogenophaga sp.]|uniref:hypothetical protein n=1 Tax=Hydrogenophaga sp. TaxID=1904254 RepID=UPI002AB8E259|nr:hypothetical protein [Hydrogenophaga sp.]MDZ4103503.1 hypothetical protein [Hydrogenophaga sp.]